MTNQLWAVIDKHGCIGSEISAKVTAKECDRLWPDDAPHCAIRVVPEAEVEALREELESFEADDACEQRCKTLEAEVEELRADGSIVRELLAINYSRGRLYTDDGELQDNRTQPFIDFRRDPAHVIREKIVERNSRLLAALGLKP